MIQHQPEYHFYSVFAETISSYLDLHKALGEKTVASGNTLRQFDRYCCEQGIREPLLTSSLVSEWLETKAHEKASTHGSRISVMNCFRNYLLSKGFEVEWKPAPGFTHSSQRYAPYIYTREEIAKILENADSLPQPSKGSQFHIVFPAVIRVLYGCGLRVSEALSLRVKDVDLKNGFLTIRNTKFDKSRRLPMSESLISYLQDYKRRNANLIGKDENGFFFPNAYRECYSQRTVYDKFREVLWKSGIPHQGKGKGPRVHDLRHTFSVHSLQQNVEQGKDVYVSLTALMVYLGHSKISATEYYLRLTAEAYPDFLKKSDAISEKVIPEVMQYEE